MVYLTYHIVYANKYGLCFDSSRTNGEDLASKINVSSPGYLDCCLFLGVILLLLI